ncbi:hypothetical protein KOR34_13260 [Posidoniimonas corsicana]|uniref:Uncharacterized protein n=1 Tax=Posidoniimonas corsicana TaxID=1938618 RepID=A0A5C5VE30_9BACT|nr:cbb3-type cytochrome c oxidase subunit I [Posidoniimonas corsicana]TWT36421.1 hypothetical protein KOR34_13260 [Posidoniimonas corsicana]
MRVVENTTERLVLRGVPGSVVWMVFATLLGVGIMAATGWFGWATTREIGGYLQLVPLGLGFLMGAAFFLIGVVTLAVGRVRLVLDRVTGEGRYDAYSPVIEVGKPCTFRLDHIDSVTIERHEEARPRNDDHGGFPAKVCRARLRVRKPRRAIVLDETENGQEQRVQSTAEAVAAWLGTEVASHG